MPDRIRAAARNTGAVLPAEPAAIVRCILDSLAAGYARTIADAERLAGVAVDVVHIVGGGSQNALLCQLTAQATGKPVIAGPVEATALGNVLIQARAAGAVTGGLDALRALVRGVTQARQVRGRAGLIGRNCTPPQEPANQEEPKIHAPVRSAPRGAPPVHIRGHGAAGFPGFLGPHD
jgi:hypothetical protein